MSIRKRKPADRKFPAFKTDKAQAAQEETDLKKVKASIIKELEDNKANDKEWFDNELNKNLKNIK